MLFISDSTVCKRIGLKPIYYIEPAAAMSL